MKKQNKIYLFAGMAIILIVLILIFSINFKNEEYIVDNSDIIDRGSLIENVQLGDLGQEEINGLILMREEEKLARDVYLELYDLWGLNIFKNIASSEQTHTDAVKDLLERYEIEDPVTDDSIGVFKSEEMQKLYDELVLQGSESLLEALIVGATVEDLDIKDLKELLEQTDNEDISITYENLMKGSRNHLRAFTNQISRNSGTYSAQFISEEYFNEIVSSNQERGIVN